MRLPPSDDLAALIARDEKGLVRASDCLTVRDYFAAQFLTTITIIGGVEASSIARQCYQMADAMLAERAK